MKSIDNHVRNDIIEANDKKGDVSVYKKHFALLLVITLLCAVLAGCSSFQEDASSDDSASGAKTSLEKIDMTKWQYSTDDDVYYQIGITYCATPANEEYEQLAVFVPGAYMTSVDNGDGTYTCELSENELNGYTAFTAPIVMPINTPGYSAQSALSDYTDTTAYTAEGFVYVHAGCRGRDDGAPAGVTDLKAAIRYIRYCDDEIAGDAERIFVFGMSGGGAQSAIVGASGDSALYDAYLEEIGAIQGVSDSVLGSMDWCPITNLDTADEAYEWMMGVTRSGLSDEEQAISNSLAEAFADYINAAQITDESGNVLTLETSDSGIYQAGTYYDYIKSVIETSLNHFLSDTEFPYDASSSSQGGMGGMPSGSAPSGDFSDGNKPDFDSSSKPSGMPSKDDSDDPENETTIEDIDNITRNDTSLSGVSVSGTYETAQDYIDALNANGEWITYNASDNTVSITTVEDFVKVCKNASKNLGAFDQLDASQGENTLFGYADGNGAHFDSTLADILEGLQNDYADEYQADLEKTDSVGNTVDTRVNMYTPLYYLLDSQDGYGTSTVAKFWRIRTGIEQSDTSLTTEVNLALALESNANVESVDFETVWGQGHTEAERTGSSTTNFVEWVNSCLSA